VASGLSEEGGHRDALSTPGRGDQEGLLDGRNMVISAPTASGKTLLATLAAHRQLVRGRKVLYLTPLRALTTEKYQEFSRVFENSERAVSIAAVSGDYDDPGEWLGRRTS